MLGAATTRKARARLAEIEAAQKAVFERYSADIQKTEQTEKAQAAVVERFYADLQKNVDAASLWRRLIPAIRLRLRLSSSSSWRIVRARATEVLAAMRMILGSRRLSLGGQGTYLATVALTLRQYTGAEKVLRGILAENPDRSERGNACYWLAHHLEQQAKLVRKLRANPDEMKDYAKYTAAQPIAQFVKEKDPDALDVESDRTARPHRRRVRRRTQ